MAQHDYSIANQGFPAFRSDLNDALAAIVSNNSGATEPTTMFAHQIWVDTAANPSILKIRNADNDAWITIGSINQTADTFTLTSAVSATTLNTSGQVVFNDAGADVDFRVEGDTDTNLLFVDASTDRVGIGTSSPGSKFQVDGTIRTTTLDFSNVGGSITGSGGAVNWIGIRNEDNNFVCLGITAGTGKDNFLIGYTSSNGAFKLQVNSQIFATNATISTSDGRYKENVVPLSGVLEDVCALNPVRFDWKRHPVHNFDLSTTYVGFIAQEVQEVLAEKPYLNSIIKRNECVIEPEEIDENGVVIREAVTEEFFGLADGNMIPLLTKAIQELKAELDEAKARIAALENA